MRPINPGELTPGNYFWRVRTVGWTTFGDWSETWRFKLTLPTFPPPPTLLSPVDGTDFTTQFPDFLKWQASLSATSYTVQIAKDEQFAGIVLEQQTAQTELSIPSDTLEGGKTYHWRVNAIGASLERFFRRCKTFSLSALDRWKSVSRQYHSKPLHCYRSASTPFRIAHMDSQGV